MISAELNKQIREALAAKDLAQAEKLLERARKINDANPELDFFLGEVASERGDLEEAARCFGRYARTGVSNLKKSVNALLRCEAKPEALEIVDTALRQSPFNAELRTFLTEIHLADGALPEAAAAFVEKSRLCGLKPGDASLVIKLHSAIMAAGLGGEIVESFLADEFVQKTATGTTVPNYDDLAGIHKVLEKLLHHGAYDSALSILPAALDRHPLDASLHRRRIACLVEKGAFAEAAAAVNRKDRDCGLDEADRPVIAKLHSSIVGDGLRGEEIDAFLVNDFVQRAVSDNAVYCTFESLGNDCEVGNVQRKLGQEPLGLLRFASIPFPTLLKLLGNDFDKFALPENCELRIVDMGGKPQYDLYDRYYKYQIHTFIAADKTDEFSSVLARFCARVQFLKRKLLEDLGAGEKIFVYKTKEAFDGEIRSLSHALLRHGPNRLLFVQQEIPAHTASPHTRFDDFIVKGYISEFDTHVLSPALLLEWKSLLDLALKEFSENPPRPAKPGLLSKALGFIRAAGTK